jgi:outer membrane protein OmpA-like peptidoglycan-associated protein
VQQPEPEPAPVEEPAPEAPPVPATPDTIVAPEVTLPVDNGAPVLDSAKEEPAAAAPDAGAAPVVEAPAEPPAPPPATDAAAQAFTAPEPAPEILAETGQRVEAAPELAVPEAVTVIEQVDNRTIVTINNTLIIQNIDTGRLQAAEDEIYFDRLPRGRVRETIVRPSGVQIVTIRNRFGDIIQRTRIMPDGSEFLLAYAPDQDSEEFVEWIDPGRGLPPLRLTIPLRDYILDSSRAPRGSYLAFLLEPPVERVERVYSIQEVKRSARIRDKVRRIEMDTLTFEFGKASIADDQIEKLAAVADAMVEILERNPAETFLIEGHTDAVGRDSANLILSDRRAEAVAVALTDVFGIPAENLTTQGYGERFLKVRTGKPERLNRRVAIRRITTLVKPLAEN